MEEEIAIGIGSYPIQNIEKWIAFDIGSYTIQVAVIENDQPSVKSYSLVTEDNLYYSKEEKLDKGKLSFVCDYIRKFKATDAIFVIPPLTYTAYTSALYDAVRNELKGKIRFITSSDAAITLYSYLTGKKCEGNNIVVDFGYSKISISPINEKKENLVLTSGLSFIDNQLVSDINEKNKPYTYTKQEISKAREELSHTNKSLLSNSDGSFYEYNRTNFNEIFDKNIGFIDSIFKTDKADRIFLIGGGSLIPRFTEVLMKKLSENGWNNTRVIRGLTTGKGSFYSQTASLLGALIYITKNYSSENLLLRQCINPFCKKIQSENNDECPVCHVDMTAHSFYRCKVCGTIVTKDFNDNYNNFCCYCGKHKIQKYTIQCR